MNSTDLMDSVTEQNLNTSQQASSGPSAPSSPSPSLDDPVPERVPDSNAHYQIKCFQQYLWDLSMQSQSARESQLSSIARRIKSGYRQLPNPKHILAMIRFNDQGKMHFKFWLRMNNPWPFTGSVEEMELWHEVDALSTQLYEMVYDQAQINLKQKLDDLAENLTNAPIGPNQSDSSNDVNAHSVPSSSAERLKTSKTNSPESSSCPQTLNEDKSQSLYSRNSNDNEDDHKPTALINTSAPISMHSKSSSNSQLISTTTKSTRISNPPTRKSTRISTFKSSIASEKSVPMAQTPTQPSTSSNPIITDTPSYIIIKSKSQTDPSKTRTTYQCCMGECTQVMPDWFHLKRHQCTHTGIKPYRCSVSGCGYASVRKNVAWRHIQAIHYPKSKKGPTFFKQLVVTDQEFLHSIPSTISSGSTSESSADPKIGPSQTRTSTIATINSPTRSSTITYPIITKTEHYTKIVSQSQLNPNQTSTKYQCNIGDCTRIMNDWNKFTIHLRTHTGVKPYRCSVSGCSGYAAVTRSDVRRHIQLKHYPKSKKDITFLNQFVETDEELVNSIPSTISRKSKPRTPIKDNSLKVSANKSSRNSSKNSTSKSSTTGSSETKRYQTPTITSPTQSSSKPIVIETPTYNIIKSKSQLDPNRTKTTYQCRIGECTKVMPMWNNFEMHQRTHTGVKPYRCSVSDCASGYASANKYDVRCHVQVHHYQSKSKKDTTFLNQFVETDEKLLHGAPSRNSGILTHISESLKSPVISTTIKQSSTPNNSKNST